jgi:hypothetical protein
MSDFDEARRKAEQFALYWYGERATVSRMEQHDPIALTPLDAPEDDKSVDAYAWTAIVHPPQGFAVRITILRTPTGWYGVPVGQIGE